MPCHCHCLVTVFNVLPVRAAMHTLSHKCSICCIANVCLAHCGKHAVQLFNDLRNCICTTSAPSRSSSSILEAATESVRCRHEHAFIHTDPQRPCVPRMRPGYWAIPASRLGKHVHGFRNVGGHQNALRLRASDQFLQLALQHGDSPGAISSLMMYAAAAMSKWSHIHSA